MGESSIIIIYIALYPKKIFGLVVMLLLYVPYYVEYLVAAAVVDFKI